jgi:hypothetical protein
MDDQNLADALAVYYEALDVWEHPSLALVCLVATIEGLGARIEPLRQCDCCEACTSTVGSGKRFRAALRLVLSKREAKPLIDAYQPRSETVHSGRLHGSEATAGALNFGLIQPNPSEDFESELLEDLRSAAREVLVLGLKGDIPCQVT